MDQPTVLFVDDEEDLLNCLRRSLADEPYRCLFINSADAALDVLKQESVQVIVADVRMPGKSGIELLAEVKVAYPDIMRVLLSGNPSIDPEQISSLVRAVHRGEIFKFVAKCVELDTVVKDVVNEALAAYGVQEKATPVS